MGDKGNSFLLDTPIEGKKARTEVTIESSCEEYSCLNIKLQTGRKHQIRIHLDRAGHSIIGDTLYGPEKVSKRARQQKLTLQLCATSLTFTCPLSHERTTVLLPTSCYPSVPPSEILSSQI